MEKTTAREMRREDSATPVMREGRKREEDGNILSRRKRFCGWRRRAVSCVDAVEDERVATLLASNARASWVSIRSERSSINMFKNCNGI